VRMLAGNGSGPYNRCMEVQVRPRPFRILVPFLLLALGGCCGAFQSKAEHYKKEMDCATRLTDERSIQILQKGMFCCEPLPSKLTTLPAARRFYLLRAWALRPESDEPPAAIAQTYWDEGNYKEALRYFDAARTRTARPLADVIGEVTMYRLMRDYPPAMAWIRWIRTQKGIDGDKIADYLTGRILYDEGNYAEAAKYFQSAIARSEKGSDFLGDTPYTMRDAWFYMAQIKRKEGDLMGGHEEFVAFLKKMSNPDFQLFYAYWLPRLGKDEGALFDKIEKDWVHIRQ